MQENSDRNPPRWDAFISYSRQDIGFARKLANRLGTYRLPAVKGRAHRRLKIFRDEQDMVGAEYFKSVDGFLHTSRKLILICSPHAAQSDFVNDEVQRFIDAQGADNVIPVLIDGLPDNEIKPGDEDRRAFPRALAESMEMPLAISYSGIDVAKDKIHKGKFEAAWYTVLANLLDVSRDEIEQRDRKRRRRQTTAIFSILLIVIAALSGLTAWALWQQAVAERQRAIAEEQKGIAEDQRSTALRGQSLFLADLARQQNRSNHFLTGALLALEALPESMSKPDRPYVAAAEVQLYAAAANMPKHVVLDGHGDRVTYAEFSPDDQLVVTASHDATARIWQAATGEPVRTLEGHTNRVAHAVFSPDGSQIATGSTDKTARVWNVRTGKNTAFMSVQPDRFWDSVYHVSFSPDGRRLALAAPVNGVFIWAPQTGSKIRIPKRPFQAHGRFSPNGQYVVTSDRYEGIAEVWNGATGALVSRLAGHARGLYYVTFDPESSRVLTASADGTARIWDLKSGRMLHVLSGHSGKVYHAEFSPGGQRVVTGSQDATARLWSASSGRELAVLRGHQAAIRHVSFSADGRFVVTASRDHTAKVWRVDTGAPVSTLSGHTAGVTHAVFNRTGNRIVTTGDRTARLWTLESARVMSGHREQITAVAFHPSGQVYATGSGNLLSVGEKSVDSTVRLWSPETGRQMDVLRGHTAGIRQLEFSQDGRFLLSASWDNTIRLWDLQNSSATSLQGHVNSAALSPDGTLVAAGSAQGLRLWYPGTGDRVDLGGARQVVLHVEFSPKGDLLVSTSLDGTARLWDVANQTELAVLRGHRDAVNWAAFSPDGRLIATAGGQKQYFKESKDNRVLLWDSAGQLIRVLEGHGEQVNHVIFSPDGRLLASSSGRNAVASEFGTLSFDNSIRLWDARTGELIRVLTGHKGPVTKAVFSPDGRKLVTCSEDHTARLWNVASGETVAIFSHQSRVNDAEFAPDGKRVVTVSGYQYDEAADFTARLWVVYPDTQHLIDHARLLLAGQEFTDAQRRQFFLE